MASRGTDAAVAAVAAAVPFLPVGIWNAREEGGRWECRGVDMERHWIGWEGAGELVGVVHALKASRLDRVELAARVRVD